MSAEPQAEGQGPLAPEEEARANLYAKFPAPPGDVEKITVEIPHFIPMDDVPISK